VPNSKRLFLAWCAVCFGAILTPVQPALGQSLASQFGLEKIIMRGDHGPSAGPNSIFTFFDPPVLNNLGEVSFNARIANGTFRSGVWSNSGGTLHLVAGENSVVPGFDAGVRFKTFQFPVALSDSGITSFYNSVNLSTLTNGVWNDGGGNLQATAISRTPAAGLGPNANIGFINGFRIGRGGAVAFDTTLTGSAITTANDRSIWSGNSPDTIGLIAREGNVAPGAPPGSEFDNFWAAGSGPAINTAGQVAFLGYFRGPAASDSANTGIWSGQSEDLRLVALAGQQAPGMPVGSNFANFAQIDEPTINGHGEVAFRGQTVGPGSPPGYSSGIWSEAGGAGLRLIASKDDVAPGSTAKFGELGQPVINNHGATAFEAFLQGVGDDFTTDGIWVDQVDQGLRAIALAGENAPGTTDASFKFLSAPAINALGQVVFYAGLSGAGVNDNNSSGIWMETSPGNLQLIVRAGDSVEVEPGVFKTVAGAFYLATTGEDDGLERNFNDHGELALELSFLDGSAGVFVFVPEPSSLAMAAFATLALLVMGRKRKRSCSSV
jgi:hypothetical protein